jgi:hypothetical protein
MLISTTASANEIIYCGPAGGEGEYKYPIDTRAKARAALSYAWWAKNPQGIKDCVCEHYPDFPSCKKKDK